MYCEWGCCGKLQARHRLAGAARYRYAWWVGWPRPTSHHSLARSLVYRFYTQRRRARLEVCKSCNLFNISHFSSSSQLYHIRRVFVPVSVDCMYHSPVPSSVFDTILLIARPRRLNTCSRSNHVGHTSFNKYVFKPIRQIFLQSIFKVDLFRTVWFFMVSG